MDKILIKWSANWADEVDVEGWTIMADEEVDKFKKKLKSNKDEFTIYIGTNEEIEYLNGKELLDQLTFKKLTEEEAKTLNKLFGVDYGHVEFLDLYE